MKLAMVMMVLSATLADAGTCTGPGRKIVSAYAIEPSYSADSDQVIYSAPPGRRLHIQSVWVSAGGIDYSFTDPQDIIGCWAEIEATPDGAPRPVGLLGVALTAATPGAALPNQSLATSGLDIVVNSTYSGGRGTVVCEDHDYYGRRCARILHCGFIGCEEPSPP